MTSTGDRPDCLALVANPAAGGGLGRRLAERVARRLSVLMPGTRIRTLLSRSWADAERLLSEEVGRSRESPAPGSRALVVMGGDGMAHLGLNAVAGTPVPLGVIPAGTGNDFCRGAGLPGRIPAALEAIASGRSGSVDLARVSGTVRTRDGLREGSRWVGSVVSSGYDARVNRGVNELKLRLGPPSYAYVALRELSRFAPLDYRIEVDGRVRELEAMLIAVGNGGWIGGGMQICPGADITDGRLDVTIIHPCSRATLVRALSSVYTGGFVRLPFVERLRARTVTVDGEGLAAMADGEDLGRVPLRIECRPGALRLMGAGARRGPRAAKH
ncbi:diacylglycerol/lipid kinase family protein [Acidipropionibacterium virtanenii]|uniref:Diacylglycerol kinase n=1 Tax=Acidipropionibacterium virtanenii TaxID=2057246 RepID=A0A344UTI1_9ACTN|nr:diacylglycerol kinase family protein [Acidipropionibacterium virtanenii]AXE38579.1 Diacylglycerol kinase [Acidipropionibacterium virtanenii]